MLKKIHKSTVARNSFVYSADFMLQIFVQAAYVLIISRELGPSSYGVFASITAVSIIGSVFAGWGCDQILIKNVSVAKENFQRNFGSGFVMILITFPILLGILFCIFHFFLHTPQIETLSLLLLITADLLFTKIIFLAKACFVVFERAKNQLVTNLFTTLTKLFILLAAVKLSSAFTLDQWSIWYFVSGLLSASFSLAYVIYHLGRPQFGILKSEFVSGMQFCIEQASLASLKDIDKPIIVAMMGSEQGGYFAVAFKLVDAASVPIRGMLYAAYVKYFKLSHVNKKDGILFAFKVLPYLLIASLIIGLLMYFMAWTLPIFLGAKYHSSVEIVKQLCFYPMLIGLLGTCVDLLRSMGRQVTRTILMILSSLATAPILYWFLTYFDISGAAYAKIIVLDITVAIGWWIIFNVKKA
jgi:O-antigen/teichoic acid export membrane protein